MLTELSEKVAVVTGAASGIGRGLVQRCAQAGMRVVASDVEAGALEETVAAAGADGSVIGVVTDVSDGAAVDALAQRAYDTFGAVHLLCNNAGVFQAGVLWDRTVADWEWVLGVNVWGIIHGIRAFVPRMIAAGEPGHVVNTSSLAGVVSNAYSGPYTTSKFAALGLTECLAHDLAAANAPIGASVLIPGAVNTRIADSTRNRPDAFADGLGAPDAVFVDQALAKQSETGADPLDVADLVLNAVRAGQFLIPTSPGYSTQITHRAEALLALTAPHGLPFD
ncbi:MAG TPA: SDR family NAD(P)-dependent oxidoreductase [Frankiaceae bacterium]|jgi:NAD(P)-dependent dehydrogenase (short-subunit alcohol dehydrogenase family)|nr:SDR family NAD(P)-dependent oxidoreductase [Frankiaceae bacterium]